MATQAATRNPQRTTTGFRRFVREHQAIMGVLLVLAVMPVAFRMDLGNFTVFTDMRIWRFIWLGVFTVLLASVVSILLSLPLAVAFALGRLSTYRVLRWPSVAYIEAIRAVPLLLVIFYIFLNMPPEAPSPFSREMTAVIAALTIYTAAINAEAIRAGILSIDKGQTEAARSLGMNYWQTMRLVILPQSIRVMLPALIAQFTTLLKDTTLGSIIGMVELLQRGKIIFQGYRNPMETFYVLAIIYFVLNYILGQIGQAIGSRRATRVVEQQFREA